MAGIDPNAAVHTHMHDAAGVDLEAKARVSSERISRTSKAPEAETPVIDRPS